MSSSKAPRPLTACVGLLLLAGCARGPGTEHDPRPARMVPSVGYNAVRVPVRIEGSNFLPLGTQRLGGEPSVSIDRGFVVTVGGVPLEDVRWSSETELEAVVPPGLPVGFLELVVTSPLSRSGRLERAWRSNDQPFAALRGSLRSTPARVAVGELFEVVLEVHNDGGNAAEAVTPVLRLGGTGMAELPPHPGPATVAGGELVLFRWSVRATGPGTLSLIAEAAGREATNAEPRSTGEVTGDAIELVTRAALTSAVSVTPVISVGQELTITLTTSNSGQAAALAVLPSLSLSGDGGLERLAEPVAATIPGGETRAFSWTVRGQRPGAVALSLAAGGMDEVTGQPVAAPSLVTGLAVQAASLLSASGLAPAQVSQGQTFEVSLTVSNAGEASAQAVTPSALMQSAALLQVLSSPSPQDVPGGESRVFRWSCLATATGTLALTTEARGVDEHSQAAVSTGVLTVGALQVQRPAALTASVSLTPSLLSVGQQTTLTLTVNNTGEATAAAVVPALPRLTGTGQLTIGPTPPAVAIAGGTSHLFVWICQAASAGSLGLDLTVDGTEANTLAPLSAGAGTSAEVQIGAGLVTSATLSQSVVNTGQPFQLRVQVQNPGEALVLGVAPGAPTHTGTPLTLTTGPTPASATLDGGAAQTFVFAYQAGTTGARQFSVLATGRDANTDGGITSNTALTPVLTVQRPASLAAILTVPAQVNLAQDFTVTLQVTNSGDSAATTTPSPLTLGGAGAATLLSGPTPSSAVIAGGGTASFSWGYRGSALGAVTFSGGASGIDVTDGNTANAAPAAAGVQVQRPAALTAALSVPPVVGLGAVFTVTMTVTNTGQASVVAAAPSALSPSGPGTAVQVSGPSPASTTLAGGASAPFTWAWRATGPGAFSLSGTASGQDANDGVTRASALATSSPAIIEEVRALAADPFGDGTPFAFIFGHANKLYAGPRQSGTGAVRFDGDGSNREVINFTFTKDLVGNRTANSVASAPPYTTIGTTGCSANTAACGPDNENGRGVFFSGTSGGVSWVAIAGGKSNGSLGYVYLSQSTGTTLDFRFADISAGLGGATRGLSAGRFFGDRLYLGFPDNGGSRPYLNALLTMPAAPGLDAVLGTDLLNLDGDQLPRIGAGNPDPFNSLIIDSMVDFGGRLYVANNGGVVRATVPAPRGYSSFPSDWADATPTAGFAGSIATAKTANLEPADRAVPAMAALGGRLYLAHNTTTGPQLFACNPALTVPVSDCDPGDWARIATNFGQAGNSRITLLLATATRLYVGYDNGAGLVVYRSEGPLPPAGAGDFRGAAGCIAGAGCAGLGGNGFGAGMTRLWDAVPLSFAGQGYVYVSAGTGAAAVRLFRIVD